MNRVVQFEKVKCISKGIEQFHRLLYISAFLVFVMFSAVCSGVEPSKSYSYRLSRGGYSPTTDKLLFAVHTNTGELTKGVLLGIYDMKKEKGEYLFPISPSPFDFAWVPGEDMFIVTHGDRMGLFRKNPDDDGYSGTAIQCPLNINYTYCAWNDKGNWLAVNCYNLEKASDSHTLGLYGLMENKFVMSDIVIDHRPPVWKNNTNLYVPNNDSVFEARIDSGQIKIEQTIHIEEDAPLFYGIFNGEALIQKGNQVKLGSGNLIELDGARRWGILVTKTSIFVSVSSTSLVVFDHKGNKLSETNTKGKIRFGSIGEESNTVYGLAGSTILQVCLKNKDIDIQEVFDLADF